MPTLSPRPLPAEDPAAYGASQLDFAAITPVAPRGLGGLIRDHFAHGRLFATVGAHAGLLGVGYWGEQRLGAQDFFRATADSAWAKLFRVRVRLGDEQHYLTLHDTQLWPFGYRSQCTLAGVTFSHELVLLPDSLVLRARVERNPGRVPVQFEMVHQEACTAVGGSQRTWAEFTFQEGDNALITACRDVNPPPPPSTAPVEEALAQQGLVAEPDAPDATTWIGIGCTAPLTARRGYHRRSKWYLTSQPIAGREVAYYVTFATAEARLRERLAELRGGVSRACAAQVRAYTRSLQTRPRVAVGEPVLDSAFGQYPALIDALKVPDRPGAVRATAAGYWVWGWDGMTPLIPCALANDAASAAATLRFFHATLHPRYGLPHAYTATFKLALKGPFPSQCQYLASLYHYVATTGDLALAREVWPTVIVILAQCRQDEVQGSGLVTGAALWPDFPEAMEEDGHDISALNNSLVYQGLRSVEYLAAALGHAPLAAECRAWAQRLRTSFVRYLYDEAQGYFISSCSALTFAPRKHYCAQAVYWITPFARELVAHAPARIAAFMATHLRSDKCLLTLPHWDTAWMADGNQLGSSFPTADYFYLNIHKLVGDASALSAWLGDVAWFWRRHTAPEAFTPEADNEAELGPDNPGCKQLQAITCWYASLYTGLAGLDFDHEGLTLTPWGDRPITIRGLRLRGITLDLHISGRGPHVGSLTLNGRRLSAGLRKLAWSDLRGKHPTVALVRSQRAPSHPVIVRADGLRVGVLQCARGRLVAEITGTMSGEVVVQLRAGAQVWVNGVATVVARDPGTQTGSIPYAGGALHLEIRQ